MTRGEAVKYIGRLVEVMHQGAIDAFIGRFAISAHDDCYTVIPPYLDGSGGVKEALEKHFSQLRNDMLKLEDIKMMTLANGDDKAGWLHVILGYEHPDWICKPAANQKVKQSNNMEGCLISPSGGWQVNENGEIINHYNANNPFKFL